MSYARASYARLGDSCQVNRDVLTSNTKFFQMNNPIYNLIYTNMHRYPGPNYKERNKEREIREGIKEKENKENKNEKGCCGNSN